MRITAETRALPKLKKKPAFKWQQDDYALLQDFRFHIPYAFLLLCKLWDVTPNDLLTDFMDNLSCGSWKREGRDAAKEHLIQYIVAMGYGKTYFTSDAIAEQFRELDAVGLLWPEHAKMKVIEQHARWRDDYYNWWYKKWRDRKPRGG